MLRLTLISALVIFTAARRDRPTVPWLHDKIVGGVDTTIEEFPHQASVQAYGSHVCGAVIISANKVLTVAHCTDGASASYLSVRAGSSNRGSGGVVAKVQRICQHPQYNPRNLDNDVSVLILAESFNFNKAIQPIALAEVGSSVPVGTLAVVTGWGSLFQGGPVVVKLQKVEVPKVSDEYCKNAYGSAAITDSMTCYGYMEGGKDNCQGDSGGPLTINRTLLVGIASWGAGCAQARKPGVYTDVAKAIIRNHIDSC